MMQSIFFQVNTRNGKAIILKAYNLRAPPRRNKQNKILLSPSKPSSLPMQADIPSLPPCVHSYGEAHLNMGGSLTEPVSLKW